MPSQPLPLFFLFLFLVFASSFSLPASRFHSTILPLRHLRSFPSHSSLNLLDLRLRDSSRFLFLSRHLLSQSAASSSSSNSSDLLTPVSSGASSGAGQYFIEFALGTPPQKLWLIADTGSDLIWVRCSTCATKRCGGIGSGIFPSPAPPPAGTSSRTFDAGSSSSYRSILCLSQDCLLVPAPPNFSCNLRIPTTCSYQYAYSDTSFTVGVFSRDTVTLNASASGNLRQLEVPGVAFGCGLRNEGQSFVGSDGVLGLGRGPISFISQLSSSVPGAAGKFSYCLADFFAVPAENSFLLLGGELPAAAAAAKTLTFSYTPLVPNPFLPSLYYVGVEGVRVNGQTLSIPATVWQIDAVGNGGIVVDSGTTLTAFMEPAYRAILQAMTAATKLPRVEPGAAGAFDLCVNTTGEAPDSLPELTIVMGGGVEFRPPSDGNVFIEVPVPGVKCLGMRSTGSATAGFSVLGNLIQQNFQVVYDIDNARLGFAPTHCSSMF